ncbi:uncharacterized protein LOC143509636 [Brachyhypopomus gauderio]|uniref:uncharacterized protein LOC143509636 n=1 Tax=Brachyhypopomus gauderio TaxID=698409 RepID=UPI00404266D2
MATVEERALVKLGSELDKLGRQIQRLLEKQAELTQEKTRLEAARDAAYSAVSTPSSRDRHLDPGTRLGAPARTRKAAGVVTPTSAGLLLCESVRGARVLDVARRLPSALKQRDDFGTVVLHVGAVDTFARCSEILKEHYRSLLDTTRKKTSARLVVSGPLPTFWNLR